jgi:hypothetical protein
MMQIAVRRMVRVVLLRAQQVLRAMLMLRSSRSIAQRHL